MGIKDTLSILIMALTVVAATASNNYRVTSSSRLNVRESPAKNAAILGTFGSGQEIEVLSLSKGWAKVIYNGHTGYVSGQYIEPIPEAEQPMMTAEGGPAEPLAFKEKDDVSSYSFESSDLIPIGENEVETPLVLGSRMSDALNLYLSVQSGVGWSNFLWSDGEVNGTVAFSGNVLAQLYFEDKLSFIPNNWYSEVALGFNKLGAASFDMNYIHVSLCPLGYRVPLNPINVVIKAGIDLSFPLSDLKTDRDTWTADFQCGIQGGVYVEWKQFAIGCDVIYDFTEVSSNCNQTLNNIGVLGTITYKFGKFGHKK